MSIKNAINEGRIMKRPNCYELGMEFMGDPEETEIRKYVEWLEKRIAELETSQQPVGADKTKRGGYCQRCNAIPCSCNNLIWK